MTEYQLISVTLCAYFNDFPVIPLLLRAGPQWVILFVLLNIFGTKGANGMH